MAKKEIKQLVKDLERQGWRVELNKGHYKAYPPSDKPMVVFASTPSDHRAFHNVLARLRKSGYNG